MATTSTATGKFARKSTITQSFTEIQARHFYNKKAFGL